MCKAITCIYPFQAELIDKPDSHQLIIALEPEAASLFVRKLNINQFVHPGQRKEDHKVKPGAKYLVIDAGGKLLMVTHLIQKGLFLYDVQYPKLDIEKQFNSCNDNCQSHSFVKHIYFITPL